MSKKEQEDEGFALHSGTHTGAMAKLLRENPVFTPRDTSLEPMMSKKLPKAKIGDIVIVQSYTRKEIMSGRVNDGLFGYKGDTREFRHTPYETDGEQMTIVEARVVNGAWQYVAGSNLFWVDTYYFGDNDIVANLSNTK